MTDSPAVQAPLDPQEEPVLESLLHLRDQLYLLKQDKSTYIKSNDVVNLYDQVVEQVHLLIVIREEHGIPLEQHRVDNVLEDCFQLISLFFLTIGRNNEAPAIKLQQTDALAPFQLLVEFDYQSMNLVFEWLLRQVNFPQRLLDHLKEAAFFSAKDLESGNHTLDKMEDTLRREKGTCSPHLFTLLENRLDICRIIIGELQASLASLSPELSPLHERLVSILRLISAANTRKKFPASEVQGFQEQLKDIQSKAVNGKFLAADGSVPNGQELVGELLSRCLCWADIVLTKRGKIDERFRPTYERLREIRDQLERLSLTQAWSMRETDLYDYQRRLDRIDESRINGNFEDSDGNKADIHTQRTLLYLIRRSYAYIYSLIISSEPVSEALLPVFNQLQTLRRCLLEVKRSGGVFSPRELYPYNMKLSSIDKMRVDGKFLVGTEIPEGQCSVNSLLDECFQLSHDLRVGVETPRDLE